MLFNAYTRTEHQTIGATESEFAFLDRCAWPKAERVRSLLNQCLNNYPPSEQPELVARLKSGDSRHFTSASFELFLHEYLIRQGFGITPHPELPNGSLKRPDFLVTCPDGHQFYLEAVCASDDDGKDDAAEARKELALHYLNSRPHRNFILSIKSTGDPVTQPSGKRLELAVRQWIDSLDADEVLAHSKANGYSSYPEFLWQYENWSLRIRAIPLEVKSRGMYEQFIGVRTYGANWTNGWTPIRNAIQKKTNRYGKLDLPLVVAVNVNGFRLNPIDEMQALFGQEQVSVSFNNTENPTYSRATNGAWLGPEGPRGKQCSGAWLCDKLSPYSLAKLGHTLYINPWANLPLPESALVMPTSKAVDGQIEKNEGSLFREILGLDPHWPE